MLCDRVLGNLDSVDPDRLAGKRRDEVSLTWRDCTRRALRLRSAAGAPVNVLLPLGVYLRHGDILFDDAVGYGVAVVTACDVWVAQFNGPAAMALAALELGNLHVPVEIPNDSQIVTLPDGPTRGVLDRYASSWRAERRRFQPLKASVAEAPVRLSRDFQLTNRREYRRFCIPWSRSASGAVCAASSSGTSMHALTTSAATRASWC